MCENRKEVRKKVKLLEGSFSDHEFGRQQCTRTHAHAHKQRVNTQAQPQVHKLNADNLFFMELETFLFQKVLIKK